MGNTENNKTVISLEHDGCKHTSELPWDANLNDLLNAFFGLCVSATFYPNSILECMKEFAEERLANE